MFRFLRTETEPDPGPGKYVLSEDSALACIVAEVAGSPKNGLTGGRGTNALEVLEHMVAHMYVSSLATSMQALDSKTRGDRHAASIH